VSLQDYINDTRLQLRDLQGLFVPQQTLIRYINEARNKVAEHTGCIRRLIYGKSPYGVSATPGYAVPGQAVPGTQFTNAFTTLTGLEKYSYDYANQFLRPLYQGVQGIMDVVEVAVSWGSCRPALSWMPWEDLQAYARSYNVGIQEFPSVWSTYSEGEFGEVWLFPVPSQSGVPSGEQEWDCFCWPSPLNTNDDFDAIPMPFRSAVKYYAAYLAQEGAQRPGLADRMLQRFNETLGVSRVSVDRGKTSNFYWNTGT
jgi:hypothetical protein